MAITNEAGKQLDVTKTDEQGKTSNLPPVVELTTNAQAAPAEQSQVPKGLGSLASFSKIASRVPFVKHPFHRPDLAHVNLHDARATYGMSDDAVAEFVQRNNHAMATAEIFFSNYITAITGDWSKEQETVVKAVLLLQFLRRLVKKQTAYYLKNVSAGRADPFFASPIPPGLKVGVFTEAKEILHEISLSEYLIRLAEKHEEVLGDQFDEEYVEITGAELIRVTVTGNKEDAGYHVLLLPEPGHLLLAIANGELIVD